MTDAKLHRSSSFTEHVNKNIDDMLERARIARSKAVSLEQELKLLRDTLEATVAKEHLVDLSQDEQHVKIYLFRLCVDVGQTKRA